MLWRRARAGPSRPRARAAAHTQPPQRAPARPNPPGRGDARGAPRSVARRRRRRLRRPRRPAARRELVRDVCRARCARRSTCGGGGVQTQRSRGRTRSAGHRERRRRRSPLSAAATPSSSPAAAARVRDSKQTSWDACQTAGRDRAVREAVSASVRRTRSRGRIREAREGKRAGQLGFEGRDADFVWIMSSMPPDEKMLKISSQVVAQMTS